MRVNVDQKPCVILTAIEVGVCVCVRAWLISRSSFQMSVKQSLPAPPTHVTQTGCTLSVDAHHIPVLSLLDAVLQALSHSCSCSWHVAVIWSSNLVMIWMSAPSNGPICWWKFWEHLQSCFFSLQVSDDDIVLLSRLNAVYKNKVSWNCFVDQYGDTLTNQILVIFFYINCQNFSLVTQKCCCSVFKTTIEEVLHSITGFLIIWNLYQTTNMLEISLTDVAIYTDGAWVNENIKYF